MSLLKSQLPSHYSSKRGNFVFYIKLWWLICGIRVLPRDPAKRKVENKQVINWRARAAKTR
jgi:hypothetical protein